MRALYATDPVRRVAHQTAHKVLRVLAELLVGGKVQVAGPVDDFAVRVVGLLGAEGGPADQAFEHDGAEGPPVTAEVVALAAEDFGSDVVGGADGGVGELAAGLAPGVDLVAVGDCELDLVDGYALTVLREGLWPGL